MSLDAPPTTAMPSETPSPGDDVLGPWYWRAPAIVAVGLTLVTARLPTLWGDEAATVSAATRSVGDLFRLLGFIDGAHGAYYLLMHVWVSVFGTGEAALRVPGALAVGAAAAGVAFIGARLLGQLAGGLAGLVFAVLPLSNAMGLEVRSQAFATAAVVWCTYALVRALQDGGRWWRWYGVLLAVAGLLAPLSLLVAVAHGVTVAASRVEREQLRRWATAVGVVLLVLSPLLALVWSQRGQVSWLPSSSWAGLGDLPTKAWFLGSGALAIVAWTLFVVAAIPLAQIERRAAPWARAGLRPVPGVLALALPWLLVPVGVLFIVSIWSPSYSPRYVAHSLGAIALVLGCGLAVWHERVPNRYLRMALPGVAVLALLLAALPVFDRLHAPGGGKPSNLRHIAVTVDAVKRPGDAVVYDPANRRLVSVAYPDAFQGVRDVALRETPAEAGNLGGREIAPGAVRARLAGVRRVFYITGPGGPSAERQAALLGGAFMKGREWKVTGGRVVLYVRDTPVRRPPIRP